MRLLPEEVRVAVEGRTKECGRRWIAHGDRSRERENPVAHVLVPATAQRRGAPHVGHVVAAMVEHPEQAAELRQPSVTGAETSADLEHRSRVLGGDGLPVLQPERPPAQSPLQALRYRKSLHELPKKLRGVSVGGDQGESPGGEKARGHPGGQGSEAAMQGEPTPPIARAIEQIIDHERHVVEQLECDGGQHHRGRNRRRGYAPVAHKDRERTEVLGRAQELPAQHGIELAVALFGPRRHVAAQPLELVVDPEATRQRLGPEGASGAPHAVSSVASDIPSSVARRMPRSR